MQLQRFSNGKITHWGYGANENELLQSFLIDEEPTVSIFDAVYLLDIAEFIDPFMEITGDEPADLFSIELSPFISPDEIAVANLLSSEDRTRPRIDWNQLEETPEAIRFQMTEKWWPCAGNNTAYELARFITPKNSIGLIKSIQTELTFDDNSLRWPRGDSLWHTRDFGGDVGEAFCTWVIKIEGLTNIEPNPKAFRTLAITTPSQWINEVPGTVHPEIDPWDRMIFLWGDDNEVHLRCPANSLVSLWMYRHEDATADGVRGYGGLMKGMTQVQDSDRAYENVTRMY